LEKRKKKPPPILYDKRGRKGSIRGRMGDLTRREVSLSRRRGKVFLFGGLSLKRRSTPDLEEDHYCPTAGLNLLGWRKASSRT